MRFTLTIDCDNAAFGNLEDAAQPAAEVVRILRYAADRIESGPSAGELCDANGNTVGRFGFEEPASSRLRELVHGGALAARGDAFGRIPLQWRGAFREAFAKEVP